MDKLRAIEYFNHAVASGSFAAAARALQVSAPAVVQLVGTLERSVGSTLFHRTKRGLTLTPDGERYYEVSRQIVASLRDVEGRIGPRGARPRGTLTVGIRGAIGHHIVSRIPRFLARYPDIELVLRPCLAVDDIGDKRLDVAFLVGWPPERDFAVRPLAQTRLIVCASADYWARNGMPGEPEDLRDHDCLVIRSSGGAVLDRWLFEKGGERRAIDVRPRIVFDDQTWTVRAAAAGAGVARMTDLTFGNDFGQGGRLVPVLTDWEALEAPTAFAAYPRAQRQSKLVRAFIDFVVEVFGELELERLPAPGSRNPRLARPEWFGRTLGRQSAYRGRGSNPLS